MFHCSARLRTGSTMPAVAVSVVFPVYSLVYFYSSSCATLLVFFFFSKHIRNRCKGRNFNSNCRSVCRFLSIVDHSFINVRRLLSVPNAVARITFFYVNDIRSRYGCLDPFYRILNYANCYADRFVSFAKNTSFKCILPRLVACNCNLYFFNVRLFDFHARTRIIGLQCMLVNDAIPP